MKRILVIDDERIFPSLEGDGMEVFYARSSTAAIAYLSNTELFPFDEVWFDHDLGPDDDAMKVINWMDCAAMIAPGVWPRRIKRSFVHSMNPVGSNKIRAILSGFGIPTRRTALPEGHTVLERS